MHKKSTQQDISLGHRRKSAVSPIAGSDGSHNKGLNKEQENGASINFEATLKKGKPFSSSGSVTQKSFQMESQVFNSKS